MWGRSGTTAAIAMMMAAASVLTACSGEAPAEPTPSTPVVSTPSTPARPQALTLRVYGAPDEVAAYTAVVARYDTSRPEVRISLQTVANRNEQLADLRAGSVPDVFLLSRRDLAEVQAAGLNQPVDELLDERGARFGDFYQRDALQAFSADDRLQCMPYGVSPMVVYYNTELVDLQFLRERGLLQTEATGQWTFEEFSAAARLASRARRGTRGVYIEPSLRGLAPFVYSGGGQLFDDAAQPTSLAFSAESTRNALATTLELLRNPQLTLSDQQLARQPALEWFKQGKLGMIAGFRDLVPELREVDGLSFDVMAMPEMGDRTTIGDISALCISAATDAPDAAADLLMDLIDETSVARVARAGYLVPVNLEVAESEAFTQPGRQPASAQVFNATVRDIVTPPLIDDGAELEQAIAPELARLFEVGLLDLAAVTEDIDAASRTVLAPEPTESGSASPTG